MLERDGLHGGEVLAGEGGRGLPVRPGQAQLVQQRAAVPVLQVEQRPAVQLEQVEDQVGDRVLAGQQPGLGGVADVHAGLQRLELGPAALAEHHDLPVEQQLLMARRMAKAGQLRVGDGDVPFGPRHEPDLAALDEGQRAHPVPLELQRPFPVVRRRRTPGRGQHRPQPRRERLALPVHHPLLPPGLEQRVSPGNPLPVQPDLDLALRPLQRLVPAGVPDRHRTGPVLPPRDLPLEAPVLQRVILGVHGQVVDGRVVRHALRHRPGHQHPVPLQPHVPVQPPGVVLLDHERAAVRVLVLAGAGSAGTGSGVRAASRLPRYAWSLSTSPCLPGLAGAENG